MTTLLDPRDMLTLLARAEKAEREAACFRAARKTWPPHVLEAVARGDVAACAADAEARHANWEDLHARVNGADQRAAAYQRELTELRQKWDMRMNPDMPQSVSDALDEFAPTNGQSLAEAVLEALSTMRARVCGVERELAEARATAAGDAQRAAAYQRERDEALAAYGAERKFVVEDLRPELNATKAELADLRAQLKVAEGIRSDVLATTQEDLAQARAEVADFTAAWAILRETDELRGRNLTAAEAAQHFRDVLDLVKRERDEARAQRDGARDGAGMTLRERDAAQAAERQALAQRDALATEAADIRAILNAGDTAPGCPAEWSLLEGVQAALGLLREAQIQRDEADARLEQALGREAVLREALSSYPLPKPPEDHPHSAVAFMRAVRAFEEARAAALADPSKAAAEFVERVKREARELGRRDIPPANRVESIVREEMRGWFITEVLGGTLIDNSFTDAKTVRSALDEHDARVGAAALRSLVFGSEDEKDVPRGFAAEWWLTLNGKRLDVQHDEPWKLAEQLNAAIALAADEKGGGR